ncbi:MAG: hypothetical protein WD382_11570 [Halofilum sp. (in: g-proteobacteria)]
MRDPGVRGALRRTAVCLAALLFSTQAALGADPSADRLRALVTGGQYPAAFELARALRSEREGEPRFDFHYGVAALETGHLGEAVFALRRVLAASADAGVRLQLGRAWLLLGEDLQARGEFERVLAADPPAPIRARAEAYLRALDGRAQRYRTTVHGHVELGGGYDSNPASATDNAWIELPDQTIGLPEDDRARADHFGRLNGELRVSHPLRPGLNGFAEITGQRRDLDDLQDYETARARARGGLVLHHGDLRTEVAASSGRLWLGGDAYRDTNGLGARLRYALSAQHVVQMALSYAELRHAEAAEEARDASLSSVALGTTRLWPTPLRPTLSLFALYGAQRADAGPADTASAQRKRAGAERDLSGIGAELELRIAHDWELVTRAHYRRSEYPERDELFEKTRRDSLHAGSLSLRWYPNPAWRVQAQVRRSDNDSSIDFHDYERDVAELSLRFRF